MKFDRTTLQAQFTQPLLDWFTYHGRKHLPWQHPRTPYRVWVSEIMLQQTQVQTVIPYFLRFMAYFPDITSLAQANEDTVLSSWSGLGYYSRARNLHQCAKIINTQYQAIFPHDIAILMSLPGIGKSTAAAITAQAFNQPTAILDANVKRVLARYFMVEGNPSLPLVQKKLWQLADLCMSKKHCADYTQAIMDLGATCCTNKNPNCQACPLQMTCTAYHHQQVANYPNKILKQQRPTKEEQFLLFYRPDNMIYLEKRPPTGIWGGLWCLPTTSTSEDLSQFCIEQYRLLVRNSRKIMKFKHSFSHFHLVIHAWFFQVEPLSTHIQETPGRWFQYEELKQLGLAKPTVQILHRGLGEFIIPGLSEA